MNSARRLDQGRPWHQRVDQTGPGQLDWQSMTQAGSRWTAKHTGLDAGVPRHTPPLARMGTPVLAWIDVPRQRCSILFQWRGSGTACRGPITLPVQTPLDAPHNLRRNIRPTGVMPESKH